MQRRQDFFLPTGEGFMRGGTQPALNVNYGGQFAWANQVADWRSNQAYVKRKLIPIMLEAPKFFDYMPNPTMWRAAWKSILETHSHRIEGMNATVEVTFAEHPFGGGGQVQHEPVNATMSQSTPSHTLYDKYGKPIQTLLKRVIEYSIMDPETKTAGIATLGSNAPMDLTADQYTTTMMYIEPDPTHRHVVEAWIMYNMMPKTTGEITGNRDLTADMEMPELTIDFTGIAAVGMGVNIAAQKILQKIDITDALPFLRPALMDEIDPDVQAIQHGFANVSQTMSQNAIR